MKSLYSALKVAAVSFVAASAVQAQPLEPPPGFILHYERSAAQSALNSRSTTALPFSGSRWLNQKTQVIDFTPAAADMPLTAKSQLLTQMEVEGRAARWQTFNARMAELAAMPGVRLVEPDYLGTFDAVPPAPWPNDPRIGDQWWLAQIQAPYLWGLSAQNETLVAVIDTGVDVNHPDLAGALDSRGYSFGDGSPDVNDLHPISHGTSVIGIIAANRNDNIGIAGLGVNVKVLPIKVNKGGEATFRTSDLAQSIRYAVDSGVRVISLSLSVDDQTELIVEEINNALAHGVIVVASVGNFGNNSSAVRFPGSMPGVIGVAASDQTGSLASFSCFGPEVAIVAPGSSILTTSSGGGHRYTSGVSSAVPIVSAAVASALAIHSGYPADQIRALLTASTVPLHGVGDLHHIGNLDLEKFSFWLLPQLVSQKSHYNSGESLDLLGAIPPTTKPVSITVSVDSPWGEFYLLGDSSWVLGEDGFAPQTLPGYYHPIQYAGDIYGGNGLFGLFPLAGLPPGDYLWKVAMIDDQTQQLIGAVSYTAMTLLP